MWSKETYDKTMASRKSSAAWAAGNEVKAQKAKERWSNPSWRRKHSTLLPKIDGKQYFNLREAAKETGYTLASIRRFAKSKNKKDLNKNSVHKIPVTIAGKSYASISECARITGFSIHSIRQHIDFGKALKAPHINIGLRKPITLNGVTYERTIDALNHSPYTGRSIQQYLAGIGELRLKKAFR